LADVQLLKPEPVGIGGWLVLPLIGLGLSVPTLLYSLWVDVLPYFGEPLWSDLRTPTSPVYSWYWAPYAIISAVLSVALAACAVVLIVLFVQRRRSLPLLISLFYLAAAVPAAFDLLSLWYLSAQVPVLNETGLVQSAVGSIARSLIVAVIWITYFRKSLRVRNTFVR
jgi:hypothetical protein